MNKPTFRTLVVAILVVVLSLSSLLVACNDLNPGQSGAIVILADKTTVAKGDTVTLTIATNPTGPYTITTSAPELTEINGDKVKFVGDITTDTVVTITVTLDSNNAVKATKDITFKANYVPEPTSTIIITADKDTAVKGDTITFTVTTEPANGEYTIVTNKTDLVSIKDNVATFVGDITRDTFVIFSAILNSDSSVKSSVQVRFKAPTIEGQVGELTSEMIEQIGNNAITVEGTVEDVYQDFRNSMNNASEKYDFKVMMEKDKWIGQWNHHSLPENVIVNSYKKSDKVVTSWKDSNGNTPEGNALLQVYVDKNNKVAEKYVKNTESKYALWQNQHLWNHLGNLDVNTFEYDPSSSLYIHTLDVNNETDLWVMTYLAYSLTPMLTDTLFQIGFKVEGGKIVGITGETERLYTLDDSQSPVDMSYTHFEATLTEVGSTVVPAPAVYEAPEHADLLEAAFEKIRNADSYTFNAVDTTTFAPSGDSGDYTIEAASHNVQLMSTSAKDYSSMTGVVGLVGQVTKDAILLAKTMKYEYVLEEEPAYKTTFSGYKQVDEDSYDYFTYSSDKGALTGKQKYFGSIVADRIPAFDISSSIFSFEGASSSKGVTYYTFALRDSAINRDVAMQISMHGYASNSSAALDSGIRIIVDHNGNLVSTSYPYSLNDVYFGYITTKFSKVNETVIAEDTFDGYIQRVWENTWDKFICKYYTSNPDVEDTHDENAQVALTAVFGDKVLPTPTAFFEAFGDNWYGPFFNHEENGEDADGNPIYKYEISLTAQVVEGLDENRKIEDYDAVLARIINAFAKEGYVKDSANSEGTRWLTLINEETDMQIVFENIGTAYFYIDVYNLGEWTLSK